MNRKTWGFTGIEIVFIGPAKKNKINLNIYNFVTETLYLCIVKVQSEPTSQYGPRDSLYSEATERLLVSAEIFDTFMNSS